MANFNIRRALFPLAGSIAGAVLAIGSVAYAQSGGMQSPQMQSPSAQQNPNLPNANSPDAQMNGMNGQQHSFADQAFLSEAMQGNMAEADLANLALQKSGNDQVKQFAQRLVDDHTKFNEEIKPLAQKLSVSAPKKPSRKEKKTIAKLEPLSGTQFDQAFIQDMVKDHTQDLENFQREASSTQDPNVKAVVAQAGGMIAQHLQMAQQLAQNQGVSRGQ